MAISFVWMWKGGRVNGGGVYVIADCVVIPVARGYNEKHSGVADSCLEFFGAVLGAEAQIAYLGAVGLRIFDGCNHIVR